MYHSIFINLSKLLFNHLPINISYFNFLSYLFDFIDSYKFFKKHFLIIYFIIYFKSIYKIIYLIFIKKLNKL